MTITSQRPELSSLAQQYADQGFVLVKGLLSKEEAAHYRQRSHDLLAQLNRGDDPTWGAAKEMSEAPTKLQHLHDAQFYDAEFAKLLVDPRFTDV
ncbi:MAG TPA: phytanoyl-CoA dioxygenase family protein, partial [Kribbella sp.]|nr:phytanoyl-CoA dioxygenase family protein [Kribbella sp.]